MPGYDPTSASTANSNYFIIEDVDTNADYIEVEYELVGEWVSTTEYEISQDLVGILSGSSFAKKWERLERLEKWKLKMITMDKKNNRTHMTKMRQYYLKN